MSLRSAGSLPAPPQDAQFLRFAVVGCAGFVVDAAVLYAAIQFLGADRYVGRLISYLAAATFTWALNRHYTFSAQRDIRLVREWARFLAGNAVGGVVNYSTYAVLVSLSTLVSVHPVLGVAAGSLAGLAVNFSVSRRFVFTHSSAQEQRASMSESRVGWAVAALALISVVATLGLQVNPWPRDGWYQTQYFLVGSFPGHDNYTPIAAPALLYRAAHAIADRLGYGLAGEFYVASVLQNLLVLLSACFIYYTLRLMRMGAVAGPVAAGFLLFVLSTGLPQSFYSEGVSLFLMSAVVLTVAAVLSGSGGSEVKFWGLATVCGVLIGLLVVTRMTPIFLIPGIALVFFRRMPVRKVAQFAGTLTLVTALMVAGTMLANHARFGRYELTNSSGRHLWQGVTPFADRALAQSSDYQRLKRLNPHLQGMNWWDIPPGGDFTVADPREPVLAKLAKEAIRNAPSVYVVEGAKKFANTIGAAPYRLGGGQPGTHWNPLQREDPLPALSSSVHATAYSVLVEGAFRRLHAVFRWLYPITIFAIALTCLAMAVEQLDRLVRRRVPRRSPGQRILPVATFLAVGVPLVALPVLGMGPKVDAAFGIVVCTVLLGAGATALQRTLGRRQGADAPSSARGMSYFSFLALMFFGSLWFSWQIEMPNSRNTLPYLPFWVVMLPMAGAYWKGIRSDARNV